MRSKLSKSSLKKAIYQTFNECRQKTFALFHWCSDAYGSNLRSYNHHPLCSVSWYEAEVYSWFVGERLPTEAEWEKAV